MSELFQRPPRPVGDYLQFSISWPDLGPYLDGEHVFVDGSGYDQAYPSLRTAGFSVVVYDSGLRLIAEAWGAVPLSEAPEQLARDGEDYGVKVLTDTVAGGNYRLCIDCLATVRCAGSPEEAASANSQRAHLWAGRAERVQDVTVVKVKAHLDQKAVRDGLISQFELDGNARADMRAKEGASAARAATDDIHVLEGCQALARQAAQFAASQEVHIAKTGSWTPWASEPSDSSIWARGQTMRTVKQAASRLRN